MTTKVQIKIDHIPTDVVVDVELWVAPMTYGANRWEKDALTGSDVQRNSGRRKDDYRFHHVIRTLDFKGAGLDEYVYPGQALMLRERSK